MKLSYMIMTSNKGFATELGLALVMAIAAIQSISLNSSNLYEPSAPVGTSWGA
jgi:hypothetical protein